MSKFTLTAQTPLDGINQNHHGVQVSELIGYSLVSIATPMGKQQELAANIEKAYGTSLPEIGQSTTSSIDNSRFLGLQADQTFILFAHPDDNSVPHIQEKIKDAAYLCDQSDSWVMLTISGELSRSALERICPLDLHPASFPEGSVARTSMEHLAVIILHQSDKQYLLLSPRSSAKSFLHAVLTSIDNIS